MARMTAEEAWTLDEFVTNNEIELGPNGSGWLSQRKMRRAAVSRLGTLEGRAEVRFSPDFLVSDKELIHL
jgi:hypothetical protein